MASKTWEDTQLLFTLPDKAPGFRLYRLEILNWGTFNQKVWTLEVNGETTLLTGDIGSGKSSLVDALTTLLVAPQRITYNKAAGAEARERSLRSYVLGYYKSERSDSGYATKPVMLRDESTYSVLLGTFHNDALDMAVTLAQVFWVKDKSEQPERFYVVAHRDLTIEHDFTHFGTNMHELKRRLSNQTGCTIKESFKEYEAVFRRVFGIKNRQALDLFSQAVSMKSVGNLTQFVREHMLEPFDVQTRIANLIRHFDDLNRAHEAVLKATKQLEILEPLVAEGLEFEAVSHQMDEWQTLLESLPPYFAQQRIDLLTKNLELLKEDAGALLQQFQAAEAERRALDDEVSDLRREIEANGGQRLSQIVREMGTKEEEKARRKVRWDKYLEHLAVLDLAAPYDANGFARNRQALTELRATLDQNQAQVVKERDQLNRDLHDEENRLTPLVQELQSLRKRQSNIPGPQIEMRRQLAWAIGAREEELPFVGELIQVREQETVWEGAIERLLHNFGLSLLVSDSRYAEAAAWVDRTHLNGRLVYYRVPLADSPKRLTVHPQSVVEKVSIMPHTPFYAWVESQLSSRFDYACTESLEAFRRETWAITPSGQIKGRDRHEKDDRHRIQDRKRYVLGWDNRSKIDALEQECRTVEERLQSIQRKVAGLERQQRDFESRRSIMERVDDLTEFREVDWGQVAAEIVRLQEEKKLLEQSSDVLLTLQEQLEERLRTRDGAHQRETKLDRALAVNKHQADDAKTALDKDRSVADDSIGSPYFERLRAVQMTTFRVAATVEECADLERTMRDYFTSRIRDAGNRREAIRGRVTNAMAVYKGAFATDTREMDARLEALNEYKAVMDRLKADDLPRFAEKFKTLLNKNTIHEIVQFQAQLAKERDLIRERVLQINRSLAEVEYNQSRYIRLDADQNPDREVREFQQQLRASTEGTLTGSDDDQYSEAKFLQVKAIVERFRGREGTADRDRQWTQKVTDVRNEFTFSASERWLAGDTEYEHYTDSGGKSGGQKEKLAYTILAASLAYQFGLDGGNPRSFRFVVIDEAFGRGSDESAQFGLKLFQHLNLQLLVVTPLQKIHVIDPYVASVGFIHNVEGKDSQVRNVSIEEYRTEREARGS